MRMREVLLTAAFLQSFATPSLEGGFINVNSTADSHIFYAYSPASASASAAASADTAPTLVWLNGGPGSSSFIGSFSGLGPFLLSNGSLQERKVGAWSEQANLLVVDNPVGVGYSYTSDGYINTQEEMAHDFIAFLDGFFAKHPELAKSPLWLTGESYAGKYIPVIAATIVERGLVDHFRLAGVAVGNGLTEPSAMALTMATSYYSFGLIDGSELSQAEALEKDCVQKAAAGEWAAATTARNKFQEYLSTVTGGANNENVMLFHSYNWSYIQDFMNSPIGKKTFSIPDGIPPYCVHDCPHVHEHLNDDIMKPYADRVPVLLKAGLRVLLYQGHLDLRDGVAATEAWLKGLARDSPPVAAFLNSSRAVWRIPDDESGEVAGWIKTFGNLTQVVIQGAGHIVPMDQPVRAQKMIEAMIGGTFDRLL